MAKKPDYIKVWSAKNKKGTRIYYLRRESQNGEKQDANKYKSRAGRNRKVLRMVMLEPNLIVKRNEK